jgi:NAD(P)-dependent dehydrogenase (short-subunit alcohol dehydrogenase family)
MNFKGKVVLLTGASGGMGEEIARQLSKEGSNLAIFARRENQLKKLSEEFSKNNIKCIYKKCDVTNKLDVEEAVKFTHKEFGRIDIVFLNAGVLIPNPIETMDSSVIINTMNINFFGDVYFLEQLFPIMKKQKSAIIVATSVETPMIEEFHRPGSITTELAARIIIKGIKKGKKVIQFPFTQVLMTRIGDMFPPSAYDAVPVDMQKGRGYPEEEE